MAVQLPLTLSVSLAMGLVPESPHIGTSRCLCDTCNDLDYPSDSDDDSVVELTSGVDV